MTVVEEQLFEDCAGSLPAEAACATWYDRCVSNRQPGETNYRPALVDALYAALSQAHGRTLFEKIKQDSHQALTPRVTVSKCTAFLIAGLIHSATFACAALGMVLIFGHWPNPVFILLGILCLLVAILLRPRLIKPPRGVLTEAQAPGLHELVAEISKAYGRSPVRLIQVSGRFNASLRHAGWRNERILEIGLPLWQVLQPQEKVALIARELAHGANGDVTRSVFVASALNSLCQWHAVLRPDCIWNLDCPVSSAFVWCPLISAVGCWRTWCLGSLMLWRI